MEAANGDFFEARVPRTGAEDFSFYAQQVPGLFFFLGVNAPGVEDSPTNHSPYFYVDDSALTNGELKHLLVPWKTFQASLP